ncbi:MAG: glycosyltransferase family 9 protein [Saprospiraceae bacterium]
MLNKVLVVRFSSLGDVVLTSLAVRCLKKQLGCEIHYLTKKSFHGVLKANPYIDKIYLIDHSVNEIISDLRNEKYDLIVDLHKNLRSLILKAKFWNIPSVTYQKGNMAKWLSVYFKVNRFSKTHIALKYLKSVEKYKVKDDGEGLDYFIPDDEIVSLESFNINSPYVALVIGAAHFTKRIPEIKLFEIVEIIKPNFKIVVIGGKAEKELGEKLVQKGVFNTCGMLSISQSASLLNQSHMVITPDTGMMHIAAALKKPIRSIWGSTLAEFGFWPLYGENHNDLNKSFEVRLPCRPCARFGKEFCPKGHFDCMLKQDFTNILA